MVKFTPTPATEIPIVDHNANEMNYLYLDIVSSICMRAKELVQELKQPAPFKTL